MKYWEERALFAEKEYGAYVNWEKRFYICPECEAVIYDSPWFSHLLEFECLCPICRKV